MSNRDRFSVRDGSFCLPPALSTEIWIFAGPVHAACLFWLTLLYVRKKKCMLKFEKCCFSDVMFCCFCHVLDSKSVSLGWFNFSSRRKTRILSFISFFCFTVFMVCGYFPLCSPQGTVEGNGMSLFISQVFKAKCPVVSLLHPKTSH